MSEGRSSFGFFSSPKTEPETFSDCCCRKSVTQRRRTDSVVFLRSRHSNMAMIDLLFECLWGFSFFSSFLYSTSLFYVYRMQTCKVWTWDCTHNVDVLYINHI
ncbi:hypothetical protein MHYP_G00265820 [Metynnis hypsauchen]